ncbi:putative ABC transporter permease protein YtcP [Paenibacillus marchantiophytorum]|uniref:ABC transporter permease protein YtcP n=1 Tax=Paenibacillus marchantiophytorum TaxID=1619310 RepID=A0ABQ2BSH9_9BACL|nr:carbohydrate ABC transporter permease [Paenibacillus marchantiophytorum]GGI46589.1 putative ABC transporter permease protein YtcP [Paenibacillus marchantiophytorum]
MTASIRKKYTTFDYVVIMGMIVIMLLSISPLLHTLSVSLSSSAKAEGGLVSLFPRDMTIHSYISILKDKQFFKSAWISIQRVVYTTGLSFIITLLLAFPLSRTSKQFALRNPFMWLLIICMLFNGGLVPFYMIVNKLGLFNSMAALVLPSVVNVFNTILVINFFRSIPKELEESAEMDGANPWQLLFKILLPLSMPVLATVSLFTIVTTWNEYLNGLLFIQDLSRMPLQTYLQSIFIQIDPSRMSSQDLIEASLVSNKTLNAAKIVVSLIPIIAIYPFMQRYFIHGIMMGSVKE